MHRASAASRRVPLILAIEKSMQPIFKKDSPTGEPGPGGGPVKISRRARDSKFAKSIWRAQIVQDDERRGAISRAHAPELAHCGTHVYRGSQIAVRAALYLHPCEGGRPASLVRLATTMASKPPTVYWPAG
eukprot:COSAG03_NODE_9230_length_736_cov_2.474097_1_plen_130_part_10